MRRNRPPALGHGPTSGEDAVALYTYALAV